MDNDDCNLDGPYEADSFDAVDLANIVSALSHGPSGLCAAMQEYVESTQVGGRWQWPPTASQWPQAEADMFLCGGLHARVFEDVTYTCEQTLVPDTSTAPPQGHLDLGFVGVAMILAAAIAVGKRKKR